MEAVDEVNVVAPPSYDKLQVVVSPVVAKGKRTKRQRLPLPLTITTTNDNNQINNRLSPTSSAAGANSSEDGSTTTEEEDTARCLILLARGGNFQTQPLNNADDDDDHDDDDHRYDYYSKQNNSRKRTRPAGGGACMYACKTCDRVFPSFQALGGHRASHKKPRNEKIKTAIFLPDEEKYHHQSQKRLPPTSLSLQLSNVSSAAAAAKTFPSPRTHECSYCGAEFASGQALGGHMRRHRPIMGFTSSNRVAAAVASVEEPESEEWRKRRNGLPLDLNLPAPEKLVISTAAGATLVDCHF